jgi:glycosyltransferase involved in cell wall biosynthesis
MVRLAAPRVRARGLVKHETGWASTDAVYQDLDRSVAKRLASRYAKSDLRGVYAYEDGAEATFQGAKRLGLRCIYDLPIGFHRAAQRIFAEERELMPEFASTLTGLQNSPAKLARKDREVEMADSVVACSGFVKQTLLESGIPEAKIHSVQFGGPSNVPAKSWEAGSRGPLRLLFAGSVSQRKGIGYLLQAMQKLRGAPVELVVLGSLPRDASCLQPYRDLFTYEGTRPHAEVLRLMQSCDALVLPSLFEGQALVILEAMSCGLPVIVTPNTGAANLVEDGKQGFVVSIRSVADLQEKILWLATHRDATAEMGRAARARAAEFTWEQYGQQVLRIVQETLATPS